MNSNKVVVIDNGTG